MKSVPLFYFPTTILIVEDDKSMRDLLSADLIELFPVLIATNANQAMQMIETHTSNFRIDSFIIKNSQGDMYHDDTMAIRIDFNKIANIPNNPKRHCEISTMISDYDMPGISGLELCQQLIDYPLKKILLTGMADEQKAVEAFNWRLIDRYIKKTDASSIDKLISFVRDMTLQYFIDISNNIKLVSSKLAILSHPNFVEFFSKIIQKYGICEYYLIDANGSFLLLDKDNAKLVLLITTDEELDGFTGFYQDEKSVTQYVQKVKARDILPFFGIGIDPCSVPLTSWNHMFFTANILQCGDNKYYWSICKC